MTADLPRTVPIGFRHIVVPGIWDSDERHWQTSWERSWNAAAPGSAVRIVPTSWDRPDRVDWMRAVDDAVRSVDGAPVVLVAHSLGCLAVTAWLAEHDRVVAGAFLVAPADPEADAFPDVATGFRIPIGAIHTPTMLVASRDDEYCAPERATLMADTLGATRIDVGAHGHINVASGVGDWSDGRALLARFEGTLRGPRTA